MPLVIIEIRTKIERINGMNGFMANTDYDWYTFLKRKPDLEEVNFWQPSGSRRFRAIPPGAPFFFKLKKPYYAIAGFGFFARASILPAWLAWDSFGEMNGAPTFASMIDRIESLRRSAARDPHGKNDIGCLMISSPIFFERDDWVRPPSDWSGNIVQGKTYDITRGEGRRIYEECLLRAKNHDRTGGLIRQGISREGDRYGPDVPVRPRLGQGTFRIAVLEAYDRACAVTTEHSLPALEASHIQPYVEGGEHRVSNGILFRSDIHRLFDKGYVTVTPEHRFEVSRRLKEDYENGRSYYPLQGQRIHVPGRFEEQPDREILRWHNEVVFRG
jgi:putative restriction endonuclease